MSESSPEQQLEKIKQQLEHTDRPPVPTLEIIGEEQSEAHWQSLFVYFLKENNPHGFGTDVLAAFLKAVRSHSKTTFGSGLHNLDQVDVQTEVPTSNGPVDLLIRLNNEWFLCIELKVKSPETGDQTVRYSSAPSIGNLVVDEFDGTGEYLYLAPETTPEPSSDAFVEISWYHVITHIEDVLRDGHGQYPAKSTAQLADYLDTIKRELNMTDTNGISKETELYVENYDLLDRLESAYKTDKKQLFRDLKQAFFAESDIDPEDWEVNNRPKGYIQFYKKPWQNLDSGTGIEYEPHIRLKCDHPHIRLRLDIEHGEKDAIREEFNNRLGEEGLQELEADGWEVIDTTYGYLAKTVPIDFENPNESVRHAAKEIHHFREIVEPHVESIAATHQSE